MRPRFVDRIRLRLRSILRPNAVDHELARELRAHVEEEIDALVASGMEPDEARRIAQRTFGSMTVVADECRDMRRVNRVEHVVGDLRLAVRTLAHQPWLLVGAATSIGLGAGANFTIFALANQLMLSVPSATRPAELVNIRMSNGSHVSYGAWRALDESGALAGLAGYQFEQSVNWRDGDASVTLVPMLVTANFFDVLGPPFAAGRGFTAAEADARANPHLVVVSDGFWRNRLNHDPNVIGRAIVINGEPFQITGVLAKGTRAIAGFGLAPEVYLPLGRALMPSLDRPRSAAAQLFGRLRPDQSVDAGRAALAVVVERLRHAEAKPEFESIALFSSVGGVSQAKEFPELAAFFVILLVVSGIVLAIACANVAGLLVARGLTRRREVALRVALGASRGRLVQQLLIESLVLAVAGTIAGAALASLVFVLLSRVSLPLPLPVELSFSLDWRTLALAVTLVLASTGFAGLVPSLHATRGALVPSIKMHERVVAGRRFTLRSVLVAGQVALSLVLLVTALTFARNFVAAVRLDPGFDVDRTIVAQISFVEGHQGTAARPAIEAVTDRIRALSGVAAAAFSEGVPLTIFSGSTVGTSLQFDGRSEPTRVSYQALRIGPQYFETMGIRLMRGRDFEASDRAGRQRVLIVNEEFVRRYLGDLDPIGRTIGNADAAGGPQQIVGVVSNGKYRSLAERQEPAIYEPWLQGDRTSRLAFVLVRTMGSPDAVTAAVRNAVVASDGSSAVTVSPIRTALAFAFLPSQLGSAILGVLGSLGTVLAMIGLFGVVSFGASRRTREIAIRIALGAPARSVIRLVAADAVRVVAIGAAVGLGLSWLLVAPLAAFLVQGVSTGDLSGLVGATLLLTAASIAAVWEPVRRALRIAPAAALKLE